MKLKTLGWTFALALTLMKPVHAENLYGLKPGNLDLKSVGALAFGPDGILFIGDAKDARIVAVDVRDVRRGPATIPEIQGIDQKLGQLLKAKPADVRIQDLAVNPMTGHVFLAATGDGKSSQIFQIVGGEVQALPAGELLISEVKLPNPAPDKIVDDGRRQRNHRENAITDIAFYEGRLLVSGLTADKASSNVWSVHFPFDAVDPGTTVEFYHAAHGKTEDNNPIRTFVPFMIDGKPNLLAGFVCTPLVRIPLEQLSAKGEERGKVVGKTVAELGNRNQPLDLIAYKKGGADYLLLINSARGVMKISTEGLAENPGLVSHVTGGGTAGQAFEPVSELNGAIQLDKVNEEQAAILLKREDGRIDFRLINLP